MKLVWLYTWGVKRVNIPARRWGHSKKLYEYV